MTGVNKPDLKNYFAEARSWDQDRMKSAMRSRNLAWTVAAVGVAAGILGVGAVAAMAPLKTVEPFVIRVNETTGAVDVATALTGDKDVTYNEAVTKYFLAQYVRTREGYVPAAAEHNFAQVSIMSTSAEQQRYGEYFRGTNPESPQNVLGATGAAAVTIRSITFVNDRVANVRFTRTTRQAQQTTSADWIATVTFDYTQAPLSERDRLLNPLGFQVAGYRADPETVQ